MEVKAGRELCPTRNIGRVFGSIDLRNSIEGWVIEPNYCIVTPDGQCIRHTKKADDNQT